MANTKFNLITQGYRGKVGDQFIFKKYGNISVISAMPVFTKPWSEKQIANRKKFGQAAHAAAIEAKKPETLEKYADKLNPRQNVLNLVLSEKLKAKTTK